MIPKANYSTTPSGRSRAAEPPQRESCVLCDTSHAVTSTSYPSQERRSAKIIDVGFLRYTTLRLSLFHPRRMVATLLGLVTLMSTSAFSTSSQYLLYVGIYGKGVYGFRYHPNTAKFDPLGLVGEIPNPSFITTDPAGHFLYAVSELEKGNGAVG